MLKNKKGFTLVELLAVIVILAIILAIAIPSISGVISNAKKSSFDANVKLIIKNMEYKKLSDSSFDPTSIDEVADLDQLGVKSSDYTSVAVSNTDNVIAITALVASSTSKFSGCTVTADSTYSSVASACN